MGNATIEPQAAPGELELEPLKPTPSETPATDLKIDDETAARIAAAVDSFVDSLLALDAKSPEFDGTGLGTSGDGCLRRWTDVMMQLRGDASHDRSGRYSGVAG